MHLHGQRADSLVMRPTRSRLACLVATAFAAALLLPAGCGYTGAEGVQQPGSVSRAEFVSYDPSYFTLAKMAETSDICIVGTVVGQDPARWNSPDGEQWTPDEEVTLPVVFTAYYVEPAETLLGSPAWGSPVVVLARGGVLPDGSTYEVNDIVSPMKLGQEVILFGTAANYYGPFVPTNAYWLTVDNNSLWIKEGGSYVCRGHSEPLDNRSLTLDQFKGKLAAVAPPVTETVATTVTTDYRSMTTSEAWATASRETVRVGQQLGDAVLAYLSGDRDLASVEALVEPEARAGLAGMISALSEPRICEITSTAGHDPLTTVEATLRFTLAGGETRTFTLTVVVEPEGTTIVGIAKTVPGEP